MDRDRSKHAAADEIVARLEASRDALMQALAGLDEAGIRARAVASTWSPAEVLAHLLHSERVLLENARAALTHDTYAVISMTDEQREDEAKRAQRMAVPQIVHGLLASRRDTTRLLEQLSDPELARPVRHARLGEQTVGWLFERAAEHELDHAGQIRAVRDATSAKST